MATLRPNYLIFKGFLKTGVVSGVQVNPLNPLWIPTVNFYQYKPSVIKEGHIKIIPAKFGPNPASSYGDVLWSNCWRRMTDDRHSMITIAHQGSIVAQW